MCEGGMTLHFPGDILKVTEQVRSEIRIALVLFAARCAIIPNQILS